MWIQYASDGEYTALMQSCDLVERFDLTNAWHDVSASDMYRELEERGWFIGYHDCGHYIVLNLDKLQLTSRLQPDDYHEAMQELAARKRMDQQDMQAEGERDE